MTAHDLPALPEPFFASWSRGGLLSADGYTADQMLAFRAEAIAARDAEIARLSAAFEDECNRTDSLLTILGLPAERCRSEGGSLIPRKVLTLMGEAKVSAALAAQQPAAQADKRAEHKAFSTWLLSLHPKRLEECIGPDDVAWLAWKARAMLASAPTQAAPLTMRPMGPFEEDPERKGWYIDGPEFYCDVERAASGDWSVYFKDRATGKDAFGTKAAPLVALTSEQIADMGHRTAWRYKRAALNGASVYEFRLLTLIDFARAIERAHGITGGITGGTEEPKQ